MEKENIAYIHKIGYYSAIKKDKIMTFAGK
jgi:hypothetical protein